VAVGDRVRAVAWLKEDPEGTEWARVTISKTLLRATGVAIGSSPFPYRLDYELETVREFITSAIAVTASGDRWSRSLHLVREPAGHWQATCEDHARSVLPRWKHPGSLDGALDCDLGLSPLTNSMPVLRHGLLAAGGPVDFQMAWISVPDLNVHLDRQRYSFLRKEGNVSIVHFEQVDTGYSADISFDVDGIVADYPGLARRMHEA
jgi:hypothetical protein